MGMVVSSVVGAGPAVLEDLETPYPVLKERRKKEKERQISKLGRQRRKRSQKRSRNIWVTF